MCGGGLGKGSGLMLDFNLSVTKFLTINPWRNYDRWEKMCNSRDHERAWIVFGNHATITVDFQEVLGDEIQERCLKGQGICALV